MEKPRENKYINTLKNMEIRYNEKESITAKKEEVEIPED